MLAHRRRREAELTRRGAQISAGGESCEEAKVGRMDGGLHAYTREFKLNIL
jgi:hypothetical protein